MLLDKVYSTNLINKGLKLLIKCILVFILVSFSAHKYYVSLTKIEIDPNSSQVKLYSEFFVDDLEKLLEERYDLKRIDFSNINEEENTSIKNYVESKINISINRSPIPLHYLGFEVEGELIYFYLEGKTNTKKIGRVDVKNSMLQEIFTEQQNKIDITFNNKVKSVGLNVNVPVGTVFF